jgi:hypothetical protein
MTCRNFENIASELAAGSLMEATLRDRALRHAALCVACGARLKAERALDAGLRALAESDEDKQAPAHLKFELRAAFDQQAKVSAAPVLSFPLIHGRSRARWSLAAAALILFALTVAILSRNLAINQKGMSGGIGLRPTPTPLKQEPPRIILPDNRERKVEKLLASSSTTPIKRRAQRSLTASPTATESVASKSETVTDYIPLTYLADVTALESGIVVRVELSPSALIAMGLPVNTERIDSRVKADVILGDDGVARAVRFVQ